MSTDKVKRQLEEARKKVQQAKEQIASLERTIEEVGSRYPAQSDSHESEQQHSV
jgi:archaellum component FlaC